MYNGLEYKDRHNDEVFGFIYKITIYLKDGSEKYYYGKKQFVDTITRPLGKKELAKLTDKRLKKTKQVHRESNWKNYYSSSNNVADLMGEAKDIKREILCFAYSGRELTYLETKALFARGALEDDNCINANILGKFYRGNIG